jgi:DNA-binding MarR family transcriptional regulator
MTRSNLHSISQGPDAQGLNDHIAVRIVRISEALTRTATRTIEARWGLKNTDLRLLNTLDGENALAVSEIARRVHVDKAWVSRSLRELEARGLVERAPDPTDSRLTLVSLSASGRAILEEVRPHALRSELALLEGIDARMLKALLDRLEANAAAVLERTEPGAKR